MAHREQMAFVKLITQQLGAAAAQRVVEIGSYDVNGSIRDQFPRADYTGIDLTAGPGVDMVLPPGQGIPLPTASADVVISCECFEHNPEWAASFADMYRLAKPGGLVVMTCASTGRREHGTRRTQPLESPGTQAVGIDYYQNLTADDFHQQFPLNTMFAKWQMYYMPTSCDLYLVGQKTGTPIFNGSWGKIADGVQKIKHVPLKVRLKQAAWKTYTLPLRASLSILPQAQGQRVAKFYQTLTPFLIKTVRRALRRQPPHLEDMNAHLSLSGH